VGTDNEVKQPVNPVILSISSILTILFILSTKGKLIGDERDAQTFSTRDEHRAAVDAGRATTRDKLHAYRAAPAAG
jgi:hypothetical protein